MFQGINKEFLSNQIAPRSIGDTVSCKNQSGEIIPPRSVIQFDGTFTDEARDVIKPDADSLAPSLLAFTGEQGVPIDGVFDAINSYESLGTVKDGDSPTIGDDIGTETDEWTLTTDSLGLKARGASGGYVYCTPFSGSGGLYDVSSGVVLSPTYAEYSVGTYDFTSSWYDLGYTITPDTTSLESAIHFSSPGDTGIAFETHMYVSEVISPANSGGCSLRVYLELKDTDTGNTLEEDIDVNFSEVAGYQSVNTGIIECLLRQTRLGGISFYKNYDEWGTLTKFDQVRGKLVFKVGTNAKAYPTRVQDTTVFRFNGPLSVHAVNATVT